MTSRFVIRLALIALVLGVCSSTLLAQQIELYPNVGYYWPNHTDFGKLKTNGLLGLKAGMFLDQNVELEGSFGYSNHFQMNHPPNPFDAQFGVPTKSVYSFMYDLNGVWNFGDRQFFGHRMAPFVVLGAGGLTAYVKHGSEVNITGGGFVPDAAGNPIPNTARSIVMERGDTFFTFNYGLGFKAMRFLGPAGWRIDARGRTLPNFYGKSITWPEISTGLIFAWGER